LLLLIILWIRRIVDAENNQEESAGFRKCPFKRVYIEEDFFSTTKVFLD
jgi:hypothetical protein